MNISNADRYQFRLLSTTLGAAVLWGAVLVPGGVALAQTERAESTRLTEILVTARKREERLIDTPVSVRPFSEEQLQVAGIADLRSLQTVAGFTFPQVTGTVASGRNFGQMIFRGLSGDSAFPTNASGSLFIDGIYISNGLSSVNFSDVERVEVLKGPQNAFFGRSTFGGLVNLITRNPSSTFLGTATAEFTNRGTQNIDLTVEGPLFSDMVSGRLQVLSNDKAGQYETTDGGTLGDEKTESITGTLYITPADNLWIRLRAHYQEDDDSSAPFAFIVGRDCTGFQYPAQSEDRVEVGLIFTQPGHCGPVPKLGKGDPRVIVDANTALVANALEVLTTNSLGDPFLSSGPTLKRQGMRRDTVRLALQAGYEFANNWSLAFNLGYNNADSVAAWDLDRSPVLNFMNINPFMSDDTTVDVRLSTDPQKRVRGLIGASYFESSLQFSQIDLNAAFGSTAYTLNLGNFVNDDAEVPAIYGSVEWDILDNLTLSVDGRFQEDKITANLRAPNADGISKISNKEETFLPRVALSWNPIEDLNVYVSYSEGVQPLQLNAGFVNANELQKEALRQLIPGISEFSIQPTLERWEVGVKQSLFDQRLQYTLAVYTSEWDDRTTQSSIFNPPECNGPPIIENTPECPFFVSGTGQTLPNDASVWGIELNVDALITDKWSAGLALTYNDASWDSYRNTTFASWTAPVTPGDDPPRRFDGATLARTPDIYGSLYSAYRAPLVGEWEWFARGELRYQGEIWSDDINITKTDSFTRVFVRGGLEREDLSLQLYVNNLFNDKSWDYIYRLPNLTLQPLTSFTQQGLGAALPEKRELGLRVSARFR